MLNFAFITKSETYKLILNMKFTKLIKIEKSINKITSYVSEVKLDFNLVPYYFSQKRW